MSDINWYKINDLYTIEKFKIKHNKNVTKSEYTKKISNIKNDKIKNSLLEMSKYFKKI